MSHRIMAHVSLAALIATTVCPIAQGFDHDRGPRDYHRYYRNTSIERSSLANKPATTPEKIGASLLFLGFCSWFCSLDNKTSMIKNRTFIDTLAQKMNMNLESDLEIDLEQEFSDQNTGPIAFYSRDTINGRRIASPYDLSEKDFYALREACIYFNCKKDRPAQLIKVQAIQARLNEYKPEKINPNTVKYLRIAAGVCAILGAGIFVGSKIVGSTNT